jgi:hypothetical protein
LDRLLCRLCPKSVKQAASLLMMPRVAIFAVPEPTGWQPVVHFYKAWFVRKADQVGWRN